jgi:hypothetical protein
MLGWRVLLVVDGFCKSGDGKIRLDEKVTVAGQEGGGDCYPVSTIFMTRSRQ